MIKTKAMELPYLDWGAGKDYPPLNVQTIEGLERLGFYGAYNRLVFK